MPNGTGYIEIGVVIAIVMGGIEIIKSLITVLRNNIGNGTRTDGYVQIRLMAQAMSDLKEDIKTNNTLLRELIDTLRENRA